MPEGDDHGRAEGEAEHHRMRDEVHQGAEPQHAQQPLEDAGNEGQQQDQGDVVLAAGNGQRTDAGEQDNGDRRSRTADQVPGRAP